MMPLAFARTRTFVGRKSRIDLLRTRARRCLSSVTPEPAGGSSSDDSSLPSNISPINTTLALSVHFRHPDLGMKDYEILSRATAFLLQVDPPDPESSEYKKSESKLHDAKGHVNKPAFPHLKENMEIRNKLLQKDDYKYDPAGGPRRHAHQLNWLEFCPHNFRPLVHVVASSHVVSPWLWPKYYGQDWLKVVTQEHVRYSLEVWGTPSAKGKKNSSGEVEEVSHDGKLKGSYQPLAKFALNPYPIHHPAEMDVAVIHLKQEEEVLKQMKSLGIQPLHLQTMAEMESSNKEVFTPGERVLFQGFEVYEANTTDQETLDGGASNDKSNEDDDERIFHPYSSVGTLALASPDRFLAQTQSPLPEGLCGGPAIQLSLNDAGGKSTVPLYIEGVVEGIIPVNHENKQLAGLASFLPSYRLREFVDYAERIMLEQIIDKDLFKKVVDIKEKRDDRKGTTFASGRGMNIHEVKDNDDKSNDTAQSRHKDSDNDEYDSDDEEITDPNVRAGLEGTSIDDSDTPGIDEEYQRIISSLRENHTPEEVDAILATVEREREEVIKIMEEDGGDMDDVIEMVRKRTYEEKDRLLREIEMEMMGHKDDVMEGEIVSSTEDKEKNA